MIVKVPCDVEFPDFITIDGERLEAFEVHTIPYGGGLTDNVCYESDDGRTYINVKLDEQSVYVRYNGQSHTEQFGNIGDLVGYLMRSCDISKSTKKSQTTPKSFSDMVKSQRAKNIHKGLGPEITADVNQLDDIAYLADACRFELESVADGIQEKAPAEIGFKCSVEEYKQKLLECKQMADWLVNNVEFWTFM